MLLFSDKWELPCFSSGLIMRTEWGTCHWAIKALWVSAVVEEADNIGPLILELSLEVSWFTFQAAQ